MQRRCRAVVHQRGSSGTKEMPSQEIPENGRRITAPCTKVANMNSLQKVLPEVFEGFAKFLSKAKNNVECTIHPEMKHKPCWQ